MRFELCLVFVIFLTLNVSQENVQGSSNIGLVVQNLTRLPTNETCDLNNRNCKYYMKLCFSLAKNDNCSLFDRISLTWVLKPGQSKILKLGDDVVQYIENPLKFPEVNMWKAQEVILRAGVRKSSHPDFTEEILIKEKLPYPINDIKRLEENTITNCSAHFCLTIALYMWCDDIPGCIAINPTTTTSIEATSSITSDNSTTSSLIKATSSIANDNSTTSSLIEATSSITSDVSTLTLSIQTTSSITSRYEKTITSIEATSYTTNNNSTNTRLIEATSSITSDNSITSSLIKVTSSITSGNETLIKGITTTAGLIKPTYSITSGNSTLPSLNKAASSTTSGNSAPTSLIKATSSITSGNPTKTSLIQATSSIKSGNAETYEKSESDLSTRALVGIVIASAIVAVVVASVSICRYNKKRKSTTLNKNSGKDNKGATYQEDLYKTEKADIEMN